MVIVNMSGDVTCVCVIVVYWIINWLAMRAPPTYKLPLTAAPPNTCNAPVVVDVADIDLVSVADDECC